VKESRSTQRGKILKLLIAARGEWVPLPTIADCAAQYNARIFELRRLGFRIANRTQLVNGTKHSWFRLEPRPVTATGPRPRGPVEPAALGSFPQFGSLVKESYGVD
jgi:hypothetical protein